MIWSAAPEWVNDMWLDEMISRYLSPFVPRVIHIPTVAYGGADEEGGYLWHLVNSDPRAEFDGTVKWGSSRLN